ncbi:MAG: phage tail protein I [Hyphomicrobiaceae bacterium]|nr:phage tail protein I [Hyphomicrobiaceae bacterium]
MSYIAPPQSEHLMPPNSTELEKALSGSDARVLDAPIDIIRDVWDPDRCPEHLLPYLAQAWSLDEWDPAWNEQDKRDAIKESIWIHQHKGTIGALKRAIARLGMNVTVSRWFEQTPRGAPYTFKLFLRLNKTAKWTKEESQRLYRTALSAKAVRSFLSSLGIYQETEPASVKTGAVVITQITTRSYYDPVDHIKTPSSHFYGGAAVVVRSHLMIGGDDADLVRPFFSLPWWKVIYPGSTLSIVFATEQAAITSWYNAGIYEEATLVLDFKTGVYAK